MEYTGRLADTGGTREVSGSGWMDHQWGDISRVGVGWDWLNLQLNDGSDLMVAVVWKPVETPHICVDEPCPAPVGERVAAYATFVDPGGMVIHVPGESVSLEALHAWISPESSIRYPSVWQLTIEPLDIELLLSPVVVDAEFDAGIILPVVYWEGAVTATGSRGRKSILGRGFVELVGYDPGQATANIPMP